MKYKEQHSLDEVREQEELFTVRFEAKSELLPRLSTLLQKGCYVRVQTGCSMRDLLCGQFQISPDYVKFEIKVIFLDYSPVDDLDTAIIKDGSIVALSAAMPGLVGAAMRRDGLSWMRSSITYHEEGAGHVAEEGLVHIKLFNQVMADLAESFLQRGVYVKSEFLADFLARFYDDFWKVCGRIMASGDDVTGAALIDSLRSRDGWVHVSLL